MDRGALYIAPDQTWSEALEHLRCEREELVADITSGELDAVERRQACERLRRLSADVARCARKAVKHDGRAAASQRTFSHEGEPPANLRHAAPERTPQPKARRRHGKQCPCGQCRRHHADRMPHTVASRRSYN